MESCLIEALKGIDTAGVFDSQNEREEILINVVMGDQSDEDMIRIARQLNTLPQVEKIESQLYAIHRN